MLQDAATALRGIRTVWLVATLFVISIANVAAAQGLLPPSFSSAPVTSAAANSAYSYSITVADLEPLDTIIITAPTLPAWLTLVDNGNRTATLSGVPAALNGGANPVVLEASDGTTTVQQPFTITVSVNGTPVGVPETYAATEGVQLTVAAADGVLKNDTDPNGDPLTALVATSVAHGTLQLDPNGGFRYDPAPAFTGTDQFTYQASDGSAMSAPVTVTLTVAGTNDAPSAVNDGYSTTESTQLTVAAADGVLKNDTDGDGDALTAVLTSTAASGTLALAANGSFIYTPTAGFSGNDSFKYRASDGTAQSNEATVAITVTAANHAPAAVADSYSTDEDTPLAVAAANGVLANDTDADSNPLTAVLVTNVAHGTLALAANGSFTYTPTASFNGTDSFTYRASDGSAQSGAATVTITVRAGNDPPVAAPDSYSTAEDTALTVSAATGVLANDTDPNSDPLTAALVTNATSGTVTLSANGSFTYTPNAGFNGTDSFTYRASDAAGPSGAATVTITITAVNDTPVATADAYTTNEDAPLSVPAPGVLANDTDPDGNALTATLVGNATSGSVVLNANGSFTYTPNAGFNGADSFTYTASDAAGPSAAATVTITVTPGNDPPVATADAYTTNEDTPLAVPARGVLANDTDPDGDTLTAALVGNATSGSVTLNADGSFSYTPALNFNGTATFTYQARDGAESSATTTVTITVTPVNDLPFITSAPATTVPEGVTYSYTLTAADADGTPLTVAAPTLPAWLAFVAPATIRGTPDQDDVGVHNVTMTVSDGIAPPVAQTFQITVQFVDNPPLIKPIPDQTATELVPFSLDLTQFVADSDTPASAIAYAASGALPAGLALSNAGAISGIGLPGTYTVSFVARDAVSAIPGHFNLTVLRAGRADLAVAANAAPNPVAVNAPANWVFTITNNAPNVAVGGFTLDATFSGNTPFQIAPAPAGCTVTASGNDSHLVCTLGALAGGASTTLTATGTGASAGDVLATATVAISGPVPVDETPANNSTTASLSIAQSVTATPAQVISGLAARAAAAGDLDGDHFDDLAIATSSAQGTIVLLDAVDPANPNKRALSTTPIVLGGESLGTDVALADIDRDSDLDVVVAMAAGAPNRIFRNSGGSFASEAIGAPSEDSRAVAIGDLNGDSYLDLVFANNVANAVYLSQSAGTTFVRTAFGSGDGRDVVVADLFGDPLPEVVIANGGPSGATVYRNTAGALALELTLATGATTSVAAADLNKDGRVDLVFGRAGSGNLVYLNTPGVGGGFSLASQLGAASTSSVLLGDFDIDSDPDIFVVNTNGDQVYTNTGTASGTFALHPQQLQSPDARMAASGKFSVDDRIDVAVIAGGGVSVFFNDGAANFGQGDVTGPTVQLRGPPTMTLIVGDTFVDPGATATDTADGDVSSRVTLKNPMNPSVLGTYTLTYDATDLSGNSAATPATRSVSVQARENEGGGGGGALGYEFFVFLLMLCAAATLTRQPNSRPE